jgi:hypothetical protein
MFFAPLARMTYEQAFVAWLLISGAVYAGCSYALWMALPNVRGHGWSVAVLVAAFPAFSALIASGQTSAFALLWFTAGFLALRSGRPWLAGFALGSLAYKPTLGLLVPFALLYARQFRVIAGATGAVVLQFAAVWAFFGPRAIADYFKTFGAAAEFTSLLEARPELMHSLKSFFAILLPWPAVALAAYAATAIAVAVIAVRVWNVRAPLELRYAALLLGSVLVDPHVYSYELVVLVPALMLLGAWALEHRVVSVGFWVVLGLCYALPALDALTSLTRVQLSVPALVILTVMTARAARSPGEMRLAGVRA